MYVLLVLWNLHGCPKSTLRKLRWYVTRDSWKRYRSRPGLRMKVWFSNPAPMTWGTLYLWDSANAREAEIGSLGRVEEMTGVAPQIQRLDLEAAQVGDHKDTPITTLGFAFRELSKPRSH